MAHRDDLGNVQVDFVWGNMPLQPNDDRMDAVISFGGGAGDVGWDATYLYESDTLRTGDYEVSDPVQGLFDILVPADSHTIATTGYSNYPGFIPDYEGDGDSDLETVVPDLVRKTLAQAEILVDKAYLNLFAIDHNPTISYIESIGSTVRVYAYDTDASGGGYPQAYLVGLKAGDEVFIDNDLYDFGSDPVVITSFNEDGEDSWIEFETDSDLELNGEAMGTIWAGPNLYNVITVQRSWNAPGSIKNENVNVHVRYLAD